MSSRNPARERSTLFRLLLLEMARERSLDRLLELTVSGLAALPEVALARLWLVGPGDQCADCLFRRECPDRTSCLHLAASAGASQSDGREWTRLDGDFRRIPIGVRKVGHIASTAQAIEVQSVAEDSQWIVRPEWVKAESIHGFRGEPLVFGDETLGVLAVFTRENPAGDLSWLRPIGDHAASAIVNARAFREIDRLRTQLQLENEYLRDEVRAARGCKEIVGESPALNQTLEKVRMVAPTVTSVLILGETGTGKELIARAIHEHSRRSQGPLIKVNCASIPSDLFESEFFGHVEGAFSGAVRDRVGRFELADQGTLFLDEVAEIPVEMQGKLLRVLQEQTFERVGEEASRSSDVRVIAATNRDLRQAVQEGRFRQDLFYRLSVFPIEAPPLRERGADVRLLADYFLELHSRKLGIPRPQPAPGHYLVLERYPWPGNVRELSNLIERAIITSRRGSLQLDLPTSSEEADSPESRQVDRLLTNQQVRRLERENILAVLKETRWKISGPGGAAELLGIHPATLTSRMKAMGISR